MKIEIHEKFYDGEIEEFGKHCRRRYGARMAKEIHKRLENAKAAENLAILMLLPGNWHWLKRDRKYQISANLVHPRRLIFMPTQEIEDFIDSLGSLYNKKVLGLTVIEIADTHDE